MIRINFHANLIVWLNVQICRTKPFVLIKIMPQNMIVYGKIANV